MAGMPPPGLQAPACPTPPAVEPPPIAHPRQLREGGLRNPSPLCCGSRPQSRLRTAQPVRLRARACSELSAGPVTAGTDRGGLEREALFTSRHRPRGERPQPGERYCLRAAQAQRGPAAARPRRVRSAARCRGAVTRRYVQGITPGPLPEGHRALRPRSRIPRDAGSLSTR